MAQSPLHSTASIGSGSATRQPLGTRQRFRWCREAPRRMRRLLSKRDRANSAEVQLFTVVPHVFGMRVEQNSPVRLPESARRRASLFFAGNEQTATVEGLALHLQLSH